MFLGRTVVSADLPSSHGFSRRYLKVSRQRIQTATMVLPATFGNLLLRLLGEHPVSYPIGNLRNQKLVNIQKKLSKNISKTNKIGEFILLQKRSKMHPDLNLRTFKRSQSVLTCDLISFHRALPQGAQHLIALPPGPSSQQRVEAAQLKTAMKRQSQWPQGQQSRFLAVAIQKTC